MKTLGIGMVGYGFIGKVHTLSYLNLPFYYNPVPAKLKMVGVCSSPIDDANLAVEQAGFEFATDNYKDLLTREDIDIIEICTPNYLHKEIIIEALKAGKHVNCEKPLAMNLSEAKEILDTANSHKNLISQITFEYRYQPAMMRAKQLIDKGFLGRVYSTRALYLHSGNSDSSRPMYWKLEKKYCGGGSLFDLGSHIIDIIRFLLEDFKKIFAKLEIFTKQRPVLEKPGELCTVEVDDLTLLLFEMKNGAMGTIEATKVATGANDELRIEIHGEKGAIRFNSMQPNYLEVYDTRAEETPIGGRRGFTSIETVQRYPKPALQFPGPKFSIGWIRGHIGNAMDFITNIVEAKEPLANMYAGFKVQEVMEAALISDKEKKWVELPIKF
ncbi:MAG: Gfo/Idh/MocA family oxidoreductase [Actinobacteria bacterium]|nr:Gfo/Idh/MocA family oxidoreductase [Actinomycetota bacterium]